MFKKYNNYILDLDGTIYIDGKPIKEIIKQLNMLVADGCSILFLTNNTSVNKNIYISKLLNLGLKFVDHSNILTPIDIFILYAIQNKINSAFYLLPLNVIEYIQNNNGPTHEINHPEIVLVGFDKELTYSKLQTASELINKNIPFYVTHIDYACPSLGGPIPDCGAISESIIHTTQKKPLTHFGKPSELMANYLINYLNNSSNKEAVIIGDRYYTDIKLGSLIKIDTVHVHTGEQNIIPEIGYEATYEYDNISKFIECQYIKR
jgi:4-nitrophenyl phosphatase